MAKKRICAIHKVSDNSLEGKIISEYLKRIPWQVTLNQIDAKDKFPSDKQKIYEGELLIKSAGNDHIIALDESGMQFPSIDFANNIEKIAKPISFLIGGAFGLSDEVKQKSHLLLSLGKFTLPHVLARVILIEQIYRAYTITTNHPYHK